MALRRLVDDDWAALLSEEPRYPRSAGHVDFARWSLQNHRSCCRLPVIADDIVAPSPLPNQRMYTVAVSKAYNAAYAIQDGRRQVLGLTALKALSHFSLDSQI